MAEAAPRLRSVLGPAAAAELALRLASAGYVDGRVGAWRRLGGLLAPNARPPAVAPADGELAEIAHLLCLARPLPVARARRLLSPVCVEELERSGLLRVRDEEVVANYALVPYAGLLLAGDFEIDARRDAVSPVNNASITLARLTPRESRRSMLDLGTGSGVQALLAAGHCHAVTAVDINPRSLMFAEFNAQLNQIENVSLRRGNWLEPVADERFDLIVANPPYVISPDDEFTYRDSGVPVVELVERLCHESAARLNPDGVLAMLACWPHTSADDWATTPARWVRSSGCAGLVIRYRETDPLTYALDWNRPPARFMAPDELRETVTRWLHHYEAIGAGKLSFGAMILWRQAGDDSWLATLQAATGPGERAGQQVPRVLAGQSLNQVVEDRGLLARAFSLPSGVSIRQRFQRGESRFTARPAMVSLDEGLGISAAVDPDALDVLFACDGRRTLSEIAADVARRRGASVEAVAGVATAAIRELLAHGLVEAEHRRQA